MALSQHEVVARSHRGMEEGDARRWWLTMHEQEKPDRSSEGDAGDRMLYPEEWMDSVRSGLARTVTMSDPSRLPS